MPAAVTMELTPMAVAIKMGPDITNLLVLLSNLLLFLIQVVSGVSFEHRGEECVTLCGVFHWSPSFPCVASADGRFRGV